MGRTLPTAVQLVQSEQETWAHFRRALRKEDQEAFDQLWRLCRRHAAPIGMAARPVPNDALMMAMLVGLMRAVMDQGPKDADAAPPKIDRLDL